jgi:hypothetical protein
MAVKERTRQAGAAAVMAVARGTQTLTVPVTLGEL